MSDETFFREVNEEIRQDRTRRLWQRFGRWILALAVLAVLGSIAYVVWREWRASSANAAGDRFIAAVDMADAGKTDDAAKDLGAIAANGFGSYRELADMRLAALRAGSGDKAAALAALDAVAKDAGTAQPLRDIAAVRAAYLLVDTGTLDDVRARVEHLTGDEDPLRFAARDAVGLASWKAGRTDDAKRLFQEMIDDGATPSGIRLRARVMLDVIAGGTPVAPAAEAPAAAPAPAAPAATAPVAPTAQTPAPTAPVATTPAEAPVAAPAPAAPAATTPAAPAADTPPAATTPAAPTPAAPGN